MRSSPRWNVPTSLSVLALLVLILTTQVSAQTGIVPAEPVARQLPSRYTITQGAENLLSIDVQVWGQVNRPGQYTVPDLTDLIGLISYAGGPTEAAKLDEVLVVRPLASGDRVQEIDIEAFIHSGDPHMIPDLTPGDVVVVPATGSHRITRWAGLISVAALVANVAILATRD